MANLYIRNSKRVNSGENGVIYTTYDFEKVIALLGQMGGKYNYTDNNVLDSKYRTKDCYLYIDYNDNNKIKAIDIDNDALIGSAYKFDSIESYWATYLYKIGDFVKVIGVS